MRALGMAGIVLGSILMVSTSVIAQQQNSTGVGGALDRLNNTVNPSSQDNRNYSGSSQRDQRVSMPDYRNYSDRDLHDEANRLQDQQRAVQRELDARNGRH
jgi:hypothetical protein